jgi:hypothetical protein
VFTEPLPSTDKRDAHTKRLMGFMKYAVVMGSGAVIYIPSFVKIGSGIQELLGEAKDGDRVSVL